MATHYKYLEEAARVATLKSDDARGFKLGALAIRGDGVIVTSYNGSALDVTFSIHAEARLLRKMDKNCKSVYVCRVTANGEWAIAKPCPVCMRKLKNRGVKRIIYTIGPKEYGVISI